MAESLSCLHVLSAPNPPPSPPAANCLTCFQFQACWSGLEKIRLASFRPSCSGPFLLPSLFIPHLLFLPPHWLTQRIKTLVMEFVILINLIRKQGRYVVYKSLSSEKLWIINSQVRGPLELAGDTSFPPYPISSFPFLKTQSPFPFSSFSSHTSQSTFQLSPILATFIIYLIYILLFPQWEPKVTYIILPSTSSLQQPYEVG